MPYLDKAAHDKMKREEEENRIRKETEKRMAEAVKSGVIIKKTESMPVNKIINKLNKNLSEFKRTTYNDYCRFINCTPCNVPINTQNDEGYIDRIDFVNRNMTSSVVFYKNRYGINFTIVGAGISYNILKLSYKRAKLYNKLFKIGYFDDHDML